MPARHSKVGKNRKDEYYRLAREAGYRSRAAYKLIQLDAQYGFLSSTKCLIDLCAAPGSWSQVAAMKMPVGSLIVSVDLDPIKPINGVVSFCSDITTAACRNALTEKLKGWAVDTVIHDGAPNMGTAWGVDAFGQNTLVLAACKLATEFLRMHGTFITKIFRSADHDALLYVLRQLFEKVEITKPRASRDNSSECFAVCLRYKNPKEIDGRFFDPNHVFKNYTGIQQQSDKESMYNAALRSSSKTSSSLKQLAEDLSHTTRHRTGYSDERGGGLYMQIPVLDFLMHPSPITLLAKYSVISFDKDVKGNPKFQHLYGDIKRGEQVKDPSIKFNHRVVDTWDEYTRLQHEVMAHVATTDEIKYCCQDVRNMNNKDFRKLLKWREKVIAHICEITVPVEIPKSAPTLEQLEALPAYSSDEFLQLTPEQQAHLQEQYLQREKLRKERRELQRAERKMAKDQARQLKSKSQVDDLAETADSVTLRKLFTMEKYQVVCKALRLFDSRLLLSALQSVNSEEAKADLFQNISDEEKEEALKRMEQIARGGEGEFDEVLLTLLRRAGAILKRGDGEAELIPGLEEAIQRSDATSVLSALQKNRDLKLKEGPGSDTETSSDDSDEDPEAARERYLAYVDSNADYWYDQMLKKRDELERRMREKEETYRKAKGIVLDEDINAKRVDDENLAGKSELAERWYSNEAFSEQPGIDRLHNINGPEAQDAGTADDEYWNSFPLPRDYLDKTAAHNKRIKEIAKQQREEAYRQAKLAKLSREVDAENSVFPGLKQQIQLLPVHEVEEGQSPDEQLTSGSQQEPGSNKHVVSIKTEAARLGYSADRVTITSGDVGNTGDVHTSGSDTDLSEETSDDMFVGDKKEKDTALLKDPHNQALKLALVQKMTTKKGKEAILHSSINRFSFYRDEDPRTLPRWFVDDEERNCKPEVPLTAEEIQLQRARVEALNARPIKKVREALARKRMRAYSRLKQLTTKADTLAARTDISEREKVTILEKAAAKMHRRESKTKKRVILSNRNKVGALSSAGRRDKRGVKHIDRRMKKDLRKGHAFEGGVGKKAMKKQGLVNAALGKFKAKQKKRH